MSSKRDAVQPWELDRYIEWEKPPNGYYRASFWATEKQAKAVVAYVDECLRTGEGDLSQYTKILLTWQPRAHPKKAVPGAKRGRPRNELMQQMMADPVVGRLSRSTLYRRQRRARDAEMISNWEKENGEEALPPMKPQFRQRKAGEK